MIIDIEGGYEMIYEGGNKMKSFHEMSSDMISKIYKFESLKPVVDGSKHIIGDIDILHPDTNSYFFVPAYACDDFVELPFYTIIDECRGDDELFLMRVQKMRITKDMEFQPFTVGVINLSRTAVIEGDKVDISLSMTEDNVLDQDYLIPGFENAVRQKAKEGAQILNVDYTNMFMSCCAAIHPLNKKDIIDLTCYEYDEISYLAKFIINKKKYCITEYIRFLYL